MTRHLLFWPVLLHCGCIKQQQNSFAYSILSLQECCAEACAAASCGRYNIAHNLFQNALVSFERARNAQGDASEDAYLWERTWQLSRARRELDECAAKIYTDEAAQKSCARPAVAQGEAR